MRKAFFSLAASLILSLGFVASGLLLPVNASFSASANCGPTVASTGGNYKAGVYSLGWAAYPGATGYCLLRDGLQVSTAGSGATSTTFSVNAGKHTLAAVAIAGTGTTTVATTTTPTTTAASGLLTWRPPACGDASHGCVTLNLANSGANQTPSLSASNDYILKLPTVPLQGGLQIRGGHNVTIIGGQINLTVPCSDSSAACRGIYISKQTGGSVFIEGVYILNPQYPNNITQSTSDGIAVDDSSANPSDITLENVRIDGISGCSVGGNHSDIFQPWLAGNAHVRFDHFTGSSNCQGLQVDPDLAYSTDGVYAAEYDLRNVNLRTLGNSNRYMAWLTYNLACNSGPISLSNVWIQEPNGTLSINSVWPDTDQPSACRSVWNSPTLSFPNSPQISGVVTQGVPPGGDYVSAGVAGVGYASPGYQ